MRQQDERGFVKTRCIPLHEAVPCVVVMLSVRYDQLNGEATCKRPNFQRDVDFEGGRQGLTMREVVIAAKPFS